MISPSLKGGGAAGLTANPAPLEPPLSPVTAGVNGGARRLLLSVLLGAAEAAPFAVLYPCVVGASIAEGSGREMGPEMRVRVGFVLSNPH